MTFRRDLACCLAIAAVLVAAFAPPAARAEAMRIALEGFPYPYTVHFMPLTLQGEDFAPCLVAKDHSRCEVCRWVRGHR
jgi:hypothetical protein